MNSAPAPESEVRPRGWIRVRALLLALAWTLASAAPPARVLDVRDFGARADGRDDTEAIQKALDAAAATGATVLVPAGTYAVDAVKHAEGGLYGLEIRSGTTLRLAPGAVLKALPNGSPGYALVRVANARDVAILGGTLVGDRSVHKGRDGEWGMCLSLLNSRNVLVEGVTAREAWGDGFYVGGSSGCADITFRRVTADHNRRQGMSIVHADGVTILDSVFRNTEGTPPECGLDLEPDARMAVRNVLVKDCRFLSNRGGGVAGGPAYVNRAQAAVTGVVIERNTFVGNGGREPSVGIGFSACSGNIIRDNVLTGTVGIGILLRSEARDHVVTGNIVKGTQGVGIHLEDCAGSKVSGNRVEGSSGAGLKAARGHGAEIRGNALSGNGAWWESLIP